jgi:hypothetical protein
MYPESEPAKWLFPATPQDEYQSCSGIGHDANKKRLWKGKIPQELNRLRKNSEIQRN